MAEDLALPATRGASRRALVAGGAAQGLVDVLTRLDIVVSTAREAVAAAELVRAKAIDAAIVVADGVDDGRRMMRTLRDACGNLVCLVYCSNAEGKDVVELLLAGAYDVICSTSSESEIAAALSRAFEKADLQHQRAETERALCESRALNHAIWETAVDGIIIFDEQGRIVSCNPAAGRLFGYETSAMLGLLAATLLPAMGEDGVGVGRLAARPNAEVVGLRRDGRRLPLEVNLTEFRQDGRRLFAGIFRDVAERKNAEEERAVLQTQLRHAQKMEALGQLAGGVAHDFNNILTAILGNAELIRDGLSMRPAPAGFIEAAIEQVERAGQRAASLTRQLLAFSRRQVVNLATIDLNQVLRDAEHMLRRLISEEITLELDLCPGAALVRADVGQLEQVVLNLAVNARDAMRDGGALTIRTRVMESDRRRLQHGERLPTGRYVTLSVEDTGEGMSRETLDRVFEPFFTTKPIGQGTGLGLATVHGIVQQAGGAVDISSELGVGSEVVVYWPAETPMSVASVSAVSRDEPAQGGRETILVAEDEPAVRELTQRMLESAGYRVLVAENGRRALEVAGEIDRSIDLLVSDLIMPEMNGRRLARHLAEMHPRLRVLFISGYASNVIARHGALEPGVELLEKPFDRAQLLRRVRELLDRPTCAAPRRPNASTSSLDNP